MSNTLSPDEQQTLIETLKNRFEANLSRHNDIPWDVVLARLNGQPASLTALHAMEQTGGEPDVVGLDTTSGAITFYDCATESPKGRRSLCYDRAALDARKEHKPADSVIEMAANMGVQVMDEEQFQQLQTMGEFDLKTSSWLLTPDSVRKHGGAIFGDRRYDRVFIFHNGADSYYAARGWRAVLTV
jgi:hypothetical protein